MEQKLHRRYAVVMKIRTDVAFDLVQTAQLVAQMRSGGTSSAHLYGDACWVAPRQVAHRIAHVWTILTDLELLNRSLGGAPQLTTLASLRWEDVHGCWVNYSVFTRCMPVPTSWVSSGGWRRYREVEPRTFGALQDTLTASPTLSVSESCYWVAEAEPFQRNGWVQSA
eukprot:1494479-Prymnesium_polylepis.1